MTRTLLIAIFMIASHCYAQKESKQINHRSPVYVKNWGRMTMMTVGTFWDSAQAEIVSQIGLKEFNEVKTHFSYLQVPPEMSFASPENLRNQWKLYNSLAKLNMEKIAGFTNYEKGKKMGSYVIMKVPYKGNEEWNKKVKWDSIYFVVSDEAVDSAITVKNWGERTMILGDEAWKNAEKEIIAQIGKKEYEAVRKNYDYRSVPGAMTLYNTENRKNKEQHYENMSDLYFYKIASFTQFVNGKDWGKLAILKVPYKGNEDWNSTAKWDSVYIIIKEDYIESRKNYLKPDKRVKVTDWGKMKMMIMDDSIWIRAKEEIVTQIGEAEYDSVLKKYSYKSLPPAMSLNTVENRADTAKFYAKLSELNVYKIASYRVYSKGRSWGRNAILKVPYRRNEGWDKNVKWDNVYFIVSEDAIQEIRK